MEAQDIKTLSEEAVAGADAVHKLLGTDKGFAKKRYSAETVDAFVEILNEAADGSAKAQYLLREAMVTADFPYLFGDVLDRSLMAQWSTSIPNWQAFVKQGTVKDFRQAKMYGIEGMGAVLEAVGERAEYPERGPSEETPITRQVAKYGARFGISFETMINDDLGALRDLPQKLVVAARRTEALSVTNQYCGTAGPDATLYSVGNNNIITSNPVLSIAGLATGFLKMGSQVDVDGFPEIVDAIVLVVPPALEITAQNILNATVLEVATGGGAYNAMDQLVVRNWMNGRLQLVVDPYIGLVATTNATTSWFLFAATTAARPAMQMDYLVGHESPELFVKTPNASRVGGGTVPESFETEEQEYKVRHIYGVTTIDPHATVASNGTAS
jgi:hypothetical protein